MFDAKRSHWFFTSKDIFKNTFYALLLVFISVGCVPSEKKLSSEDIEGDTSYGGFSGLDSAQTISESKVTLAWTASTSSEVTGYNIYNVTLPSNPVLIKTVDSDTTSTTLSGLNEGFLYKFRVKLTTATQNEDGNERDLPAIPYSGVQSSTVLSSTSVRLDYIEPSPGEALEARAYCQVGTDPAWQLMATITDMSLTSVDITGLMPNLSYVCRVNVVVDGREDNNLSTVSFVALGQADRLVFVTEPGNAQSGELLTQQPVVHVLDENDNIVSGGPDSTALITLTVSVASPTTGSVRGTFAVNAVAGVATFTDLYIEEAGLKILSATKADTSSLSFGTPSMSVDSAQFNITSGNISPTLSTLTIDPPSTPQVANGTDFYVVTFTLRDQFGNPVAGILPQFSSNTLGDFLSQPVSPTDVAGQTTGTISTTVSDTNTSNTRTISISSPSGLNTVDVDAPFDPGPANRLSFTVQPINSPAGANGLNELRVAVQDVQGNIITTGSGSTDTINMSISNNVGGAVLSGTTSRAAVAGIAIFDDLGIDITANGYRLISSSGSLNPATSNNFNVTAGQPQVISMTGPTDTLSGSCSGTITLQLQDLGGNPARAVSNTTVQLSGLGNASLYSSNTCAGVPLSTNVTFTPGTDTRTLFLESQKVEALTIVGTDASAVLTPSNYNINVTPSRMRFTAEAALPTPPGNDLLVTAGTCSTAMTITPLAEDGSQGEVFSSTTVSLTGITGSQATIYSDASCTTVVDPASVSLNIASPPNEDTILYIQDPRGETLSVNVVDVSGDIATVSTPQTIRILASDIDFVGPSTVVAGQCSAVFTITLEDTQGNNVDTPSNLNLDVVGLSGSPTGQFYTSPSCSGGGSNSSVTVPASSAITTVYFRGLNSEILNISISDPNGDMNNSQVVNLTVSPSEFRITSPGGSDSMTSECAGPFVLDLLDGQGSVSQAVGTIVGNLSGEGDAGGFYSDATCDTSISSLTFTTGESTENFYFRGQYPEASLTLAVADNAGTLTGDTLAWSIIADLGYLGTASVSTDSMGDLLPFRTGFKPVASRYDGIYQAQQIAFSPDNTKLYVADYGRHKITKYDYSTNEYLGWIGALRKENGIGATGSNVATPSPALCVSTNNYEPLPGWCTGGRAVSTDLTTGGLGYPWGIAADANYVYVTSYNNHYITRHDAVTGAFDGWIGFINNSTPTGTGTGGAAGCTSAPNSSQTPGWCIGGNRMYHNTTHDGDGRLRYPRGLTIDAVYMYVASERAVLRYDKTTGAFTGWIGMVDTISPTGGEAGCTSTTNNQVTPGWCTGGRYKNSDPRSTGAVNTATDIIIDGTDMYVLNSGNGGVINRYNVTTGAFIETLANLNFTWTNPQQFTYDGTHFYVADDERILKVSSTGLIESWMGKVANNAGMSGNPGCNSLSPNDNTPGWCLGGTHKPGLDEESFINTWGIADDGAGNLLAISRNLPMIKKFDKTTGNYQGSLGAESVSPTSWTSDRTADAEFYGFDDHSGYNPLGSIIIGDTLYLTDREGSRIKKINKKTGELLGWIGGITSSPTGGENPGCPAANAYGPAPGWCLGANMYPSFTWGDNNMIDDNADGIMRNPYGLATDGTWLYVTDRALHRIQRFNASTGAYGGWIGRVGNISPTGGDPGCSGTPNNSVTPGWCLGGISESGNADGNMNEPAGITYNGGNLYVIDANNERVISINAVSGAFNGWIGRVNAAPSSGCTTGSNGQYTVSLSGWCIGGTARRANDRTDRGGGFNFEWDDRGDIFTDGSFLYVTNTRNIRIDKIGFDGTFIEAFRTRQDNYTQVWTAGPSTAVGSVSGGSNCSYPIGVWGDATHMYVLVGSPCNSTGTTLAVIKVDKTTGSVFGWKGGIDSANTPTGGEPGCAGATGTTPAWCQGGRVSVGAKLGQFSGNHGMLTGDNEFIYVTDYSGNRIVRVPK